MEFPPPTYDVYTLGYFQAKLCRENYSVASAYFQYGRKQRRQKEGPNFETVDLHW